MFWSDAGGGPKAGGWDVQVPSDMGGRGVVWPIGLFGPLYKRYSTLVMIVGQCGLSMTYV